MLYFLVKKIMVVLLRGKDPNKHISEKKKTENILYYKNLNSLLLQFTKLKSDFKNLNRDVLSITSSIYHRALLRK